MHVRVGVAVGANQSVVAEVVVGGIEAVEVTAVGIYFHATFTFPSARLVDEVPDEATLQIRVFANDVPIFFKSALRVAHSVSIFALYERFGSVGASAVVFHAVVVAVHRAIYVGGTFFAGLFKLACTTRVFLFNPLVALFEVRSVARLVTERPEYDARVVEPALHIALIALEVSLEEVRVLGESLVVVAHTMRFDVGFGYYIYTVAVAEVIPQVVVGVVASANGIQVVFLHNSDVLQHSFGRNHIATVGI